MTDKDIKPVAPGAKVDDSPDPKALAEAQKPDPHHDYGNGPAADGKKKGK